MEQETYITEQAKLLISEQADQFLMEEGEGAQCMGRLMGSEMMLQFQELLDSELRRGTAPPNLVNAFAHIMPMMMAMVIGPVMKKGKEDDAIEKTVQQYKDGLSTLTKGMSDLSEGQ